MGEDGKNQNNNKKAKPKKKITNHINRELNK